MFAEPLDDYEIAYFKFPREDCYSFWNLNVDFSLSLAFLNSENEIVDFQDLEKQSAKSVSPNSNNVKFVVEANKGLFKKLDINVGDKLVLRDNKLILKKKIGRAHV